MRIALVAHHARPTGGQDRYLLELARHLSPRHDVHLIVVKAEGTQGLKLTLHELGIADRPMVTLAPRFAKRVAGIVKGGGFDIVHAIGGSYPGANVITAQYCQAAWREARARYRVLESSFLGDWYHALVTAQQIGFEQRAYAAPELRSVVAVSRGTAQDLTRFYGVKPELISVVHNGVDPDVFVRSRYPTARADLRRSLGIADDATIALLIGTYARKGLETAIAAVSRASGTLHLVVAGSGDDALARRWARAASLDDRLHLLGPRSDVAMLYAASDLFVLPTRYEPFGMVIAEAMAAELPVVVSACSGAAELITNGANGFIVERADDTDGFAAHITALLADASRREMIGKAARSAALGVTWDQVAARTEQAYARVHA